MKKVDDEDNILKGAMRAALIAFQMIAGMLALLIAMMWMTTGKSPLEVFLE